MFRLYQIEGQPEKANEYLTRLSESWPDIVFCTQSYLIVQELQTSPQKPAYLAKTTAWCEDFRSTTQDPKILPGIGPLGVTEAYYLAYLNWVRMQLLLGNPSVTLVYLQQQLHLAQTNGLTARKIELNLLLAQSWQADGDGRQAMKALEEALTDAQSAGFIRSFEMGHEIDGLLHQAIDQGICVEYAKKILK